MKPYNDDQNFSNTICLMLDLSPESDLAFKNAYKPADTYMHCTLMYFGERPSLTHREDKVIDTIIDVVDEVTDNITVKTKGVDTFGEDGSIAVVLLDSIVLNKVNSKIKKALDIEGIEYSNDHPQFKGHITLGKLEENEKLPEYVPMEVTFTHMSLSVGEETYTAPLVGEEGETVKEVKYIDTDPDPSPNPGATRLRKYWLHGKGAAKIRWGAKGDWRRCVKHLRKHVGTGAPGLCFTGDTKFLTSNGIYALKDCVGSTINVLTSANPTQQGNSYTGFYAPAQIQYFGEQQVYEVVLSRNGQTKKVRATSDHIWFASKDGKSEERKYIREVRTVDLLPNMALASLSLRPSYAKERTRSRKRWKVVEVKPSGVEPVYCAVVEGTENFTLEDNILVHNCQVWHKEANGFYTGDRRNKSDYQRVMNKALNLVELTGHVTLDKGVEQGNTNAT